MKTKLLITLSKSIFLGVLATLIILPMTSSAKKIHFLASTVTPAAEGYIKIKKDKNKNYVIQLHVKNLVEIDKLQPIQQTYVVWMVTDREITKNIGRVATSNNLNVSFETVSSFKPTKIFITAETDESVQYPGEKLILTTEKFWD